MLSVSHISLTTIRASTFPLRLSCSWRRYLIQVLLLSPNDVSSHVCTDTPLLIHSHLYDSTHRQTYEFAHSVILAILAWHAQGQQQQQLLAGNHNSGPCQPSTKVSLSDNARNLKYLNDHHMTRAASKPEQLNETDAYEGTMISRESNYEDESIISAKFMQSLVPFYAKCLIEVSALLLLLFDFVVKDRPSLKHWPTNGLQSCFNHELFELRCLLCLFLPDPYRIPEREN